MKEPIRIAHIVGKWVGGGVESVVMNYYRHIDKSKIQFDLICDSDSTNIPYEEIESMGGRVIIVPPYQKLFKYQKELKKVFKEGNYKIVHSHINTLSIFPLRIAKKVGIPVRIAHSHSTTNKKEWKKNFFKQVLRPFSKVYATDYFACSELAGRWLFGNKEYDKGNVYLLNNAIDVDKFKYDEELRKKKRKELGIKGNTLVIGHVGRFVEQKNHEFLIGIFNEVCKKEKNAVLLLVGQGPLEDKIKEKVKDYGLSKNVKFLGQRNDVNELYQAFDVFLLPSLYEGLPVVGVEAQAAGLLCVFSSSMTKETKVLESTVFLDLSLSCGKWSDEVIKRYSRMNTTCEISNNCFNIINEVKKIEKKYNDFLKIRVCHVLSGLNSGGVESIVYNYCSNMNTNKFEWYLLYQHEPSEKNIIEFTKIGFKLKRIPSKIIRPFSNYMQTKKYFKENKIDVVHAHMTLMNFIPLLAAKHCKIRIRISHSHNSYDEKKYVKRMFNDLCRFLTINSATNFLSCGEDAGKFLYGSRNFIIINNALDLNKFIYNKYYREKIRRKYNISDDFFVIGHVGRFTYQKNHEFIITVFEKLYKYNKKIILILVGNGEKFNDIKKMVKIKDIEKNVILTGIVNNTNEIYSAMDCFILPSRWEGLPVVGIEAQISGLKCIFSNNIDKDVIINKKNSNILTLDEDKWVDKLKVISNNFNYNRNNFDEMVENFGYDIKKEVKKLENIYEE